MKTKKVLVGILLTSTMAYSFDLGSITKSVLDTVNKPSTSTNDNQVSSLDSATVNTGLKEALKVGVNYAVTNLSKENGYLNNKYVKIPLPENLAKVETVIRSAGGDKIADDLINSMNKAASKAASKTAEVFISAIEKMSIDDAKKILAGDDKAATIYFEVSTSDSLKNLIKPIVQETIQENNVAKYYDKANSFYKNNVKSYVDSSSVMGYAKNFGVDSYLPGSSDESIDDFVTNKAITGLFTMIAQKENEIRNSTTARTTDLLKKVFSK